jgi:hypothetical protein
MCRFAELPDPVYAALEAASVLRGTASVSGEIFGEYE